MSINISDHFTLRKLLRFSIPSIVMMVFTSIYGIVDGFFISNYVGKNEFAAINFIYPFIMILGVVGFMVGAGGSALIGKTLGQGKKDKANSYFSLFVYFLIFISFILTIVAYIFIGDVALFLGATPAMYEYCVLYGRILILGNVFFNLQYCFQSFYVTSGKPKLGLYATLAAGITNMVLDYLFIVVFGFGLKGAGFATMTAQVVGGSIPIIYYSRNNSSLLKLGKCELDFKALGKTLSNGSSEFVSNISMSVVSMLYNSQLLKYAGEDGVSAYGVLMFVCLVFLSIFIGLSVGTAPIISYNYGAGNKKELNNVFKKCLIVLAISAIFMFAAGELLAKPLSMIFVGYDENLLDLTISAFKLYSFSFLFAFMPIYGSSFFTALNNGKVSAIISFLRTCVFQIICVIVLPMFIGINGIWISTTVAELLSLLLTLYFLIRNRNYYGY